jgi:hypothetical protein
MQYAQLNEDGTYGHQITTSGNIEWDDYNFCSAAALIKDGKAAQFRVVELHEVDATEIDPMTQTVTRDGGEFVEGQWKYKWRVDELTPEQVAENVAEKEGKAVATAKAKRNNLLSDSDWVVIKLLEVGAPAPAEWATYRQALRDIPQQEGFPVTITWPVKPE